MLSLPQHRIPSGTDGVRCVLMYLCGGRIVWEKSLWENNPISQDTTVMVLFVRPTLIAPPVSLCQFTELVTQCSAFPFMVFNASHCSKAMSGFRNVWNEFRVCQGNLKNSLGFYSAAFTLRQKKYFYFFLLTSDTDRNLLHKTQNTKTCTIYYFFFLHPIWVTSKCGF